jgi:histidinol-phosphate aminotransferase
MLADIEQFDNLFVARTFSKAYGLAGLRAGVLAGDPEQLKFVRRVSSPYNVNSVALACLPDALADCDYLSDYVAQVKRARLALERELESQQVPFWPSEANFILTYFGDYRAAFVQAMRVRGILVRDRHNDPGCAGCVRITVGSEQQTDRLIAAMRNALTDIGYRPQSREANA